MCLGELFHDDFGCYLDKCDYTEDTFKFHLGSDGERLRVFLKEVYGFEPNVTLRED